MTNRLWIKRSLAWSKQPQEWSFIGRQLREGSPRGGSASGTNLRVAGGTECGLSVLGRLRGSGAEVHEWTGGPGEPGGIEGLGWREGVEAACASPGRKGRGAGTRQAQEPLHFEPLSIACLRKADQEP